MKAFAELATCRQIGMSAGPIPLRDIWAYADRAGLEPDVADLFARVIMAMDAVWLEWNGEETKMRAEARQAKTSAPTSTPQPVRRPPRVRR